MNPNSEDDQTNQNNTPSPQDDSPTPPVNPGGVVRPQNTQPAPTESAPESNPAPETSTTPPQAPSGTEQAPPQQQPANTPPTPPAEPSAPQPASAQPPAGSDRQIFPSDSNSPAPGSGGRKFFGKKLLLIAVPILLVLLAAGYVFGYYIPNQPENVYRTGLDRSGDALEMLVNKSTEQETYDKFKRSEITANMDMDFNGQKVNSDLTAKFDEDKLDADLNVSIPSDADQLEAGFTILSEKAEGNQYPDTYINIRGLEPFGVGVYFPSIDKIDGKWLEISADYIKGLAEQYGVEAQAQQDNTEDFPTFDEISSLIRDVYADTNEYVLTSDPEKAVIENRQYLGKEEVEGVDSFHYEVAINQENYKKYCEAFSNTLWSSPAYQKFSGFSDEGIETEKQNISKNCQEESDAIKDDDTFEMWVDSKYKLIKKIRIYTQNKESYYDIGQNYDGSDKVSLFLALGNVDGSFDSKATFTTDLNTAESSGEVTFNGGEGSDAYEGNITLNAKPLTEDFEIEKPEGMVDIRDFLRDMGINPREFTNMNGGPGVQLQ